MHSPSELEGAFARAAAEGIDEIIVLSDPLTLSERAHIVDLAAQAHLPTMYTLKEFVDAGGLLSYGPKAASLVRRAAYSVDRILKGTKSADPPVEQLREFHFRVNLQAARTLGLTIPQHVLLQRTEVIQ